MSITPAVLDAMVASGCTAEQIAAAVKASMAEQENKAEAKREKDRERKRRQRARDAGDSHAESRDVTRTECDGEDAPLSLPPNDNNSNPPTHTPVNNTPARGDNFPCPEWCEPQVWRDLKANRKTKRLANTPTAHKQFLRDIEKLADDEWPPGRLVEAIAARGWGGAYDPRDDRKPKNDNRTSKPSGRNAAELARSNFRHN